MEYAHIYNRGIDKKDIFWNSSDYIRFQRSLYFFNDDANREFRSYSFRVIPPLRKGKLVHILAYCLMPNHFHLLVAYDDRDKLGRFMHKLLTSYTKYCNIKYKRSGHLFQSGYKMKDIESEDSLIHVSAYIHANPVVAKLCGNLVDFKWSSYKDAIGEEIDFVVSGKDFMPAIDSKHYSEYVDDLVASKEKLSYLEDLYEG